jgi:HEAT repeat protein
MPRHKTSPPLEDAFREALAEPSPVRSRNKFMKVLHRLREDCTADLRLVGYLLDGLERFAGHDVADQIAGEYLPRFGPAVVPELRQALNLQGTKADALRLAALVNIDPAGGRKLCNTALQHGSDVVRARAMRGLTKLDPRMAEQLALDFLSHQKSGIQFQNAALAALAGSRSDKALELLLAALPRRRLVWSAHFALKASPHPRLLACLQTHFASLLDEIGTGTARVDGTNGHYLWHLMNILIDRPEPGGLVAVIRLMDHPLAAVRQNATSTVWCHINNHALAGKRAIPELTAALKYPDPKARDAAAIVLGRGGAAARAAVPALVEMLQTEPEFGVRRQAAETLGNIGTPVSIVVPALVAALQDPSPWLRRQVAESLGRIGPPAREALPWLVKALEDPDATVTAEVPEALTRIGPLRVVLPTLTEALRHQHQGVRGRAANALGELGPRARQAIPALIDLLRDTEGWVIWRAADALAKMEASANGAVPALCALLQSPSAGSSHSGYNRYIRAAAVKALGAIGPAAQAAVPVLLALRKGSDRALREAVASALTAIEKP